MMLLAGFSSGKGGGVTIQGWTAPFRLPLVGVVYPELIVFQRNARRVCRRTGATS